MKLSDLLAEELWRRGVRHVYGLTGGAVVHMFDSVARHPGLKPVFHHHEQAGSFALVADGRVRDGVGAGIFTTGPGGVNALAGVAAAWMDSIPALFISGQTRREHSSRGTGTRQVGTQEFDIAALVAPMVKRATMLERPEDILYELDAAFHEATSGRPGPVWLDIPLNFQWAEVDPAQLRRFEPPAAAPVDPAQAARDVAVAAEMLKTARRPLCVLGAGVRGEAARRAAAEFLRSRGVPYVVTYNSLGFWSSDDPLNLGVLGLAGQRGANLAVQNADFLLALGSHLCIPQTGTQFQNFSPLSKRCVVNIDAAQLAYETVRVDHRVQMDAGAFIEALAAAAPEAELELDPRWAEMRDAYRAATLQDLAAVDPENPQIDQYAFVRALSGELAEGDVVTVDGGGTNVYIAFQALAVKPGQRVVMSSGLCSMGSGMPEAIGAAFASGRRTVCLVGDGSFMLNLQELATIRHHNLPIKVFVFNNAGYVSIRDTQSGFLEGRFFGSSAQGGVAVPDIRRLAAAFDLPTLRLDDKDDFIEPLRAFLAADGPGVCEVVISPGQEVRPRQSFRLMDNGAYAPAALDDMAPHLDEAQWRALNPWRAAAGA